MTVHIDLAKAQSLVAECIAERGEDYVYEKEGSTCKYVHNVGQVMGENEFDYEDDFTDATPGCLVGLALSKVGVPLEFMGGSRNMDGSMDLMKAVADAGYITFTEQADAFLANCQSSQDGGAPWGTVLEPASKGKQLDRHYDYSQYENGEPKFIGFREVEGSPVE
jgi:hypothetical protein